MRQWGNPRAAALCGETNPSQCTLNELNCVRAHRRARAHFYFRRRIVERITKEEKQTQRDERGSWCLALMFERENSRWALTMLEREKSKTRRESAGLGVGSLLGRQRQIEYTTNGGASQDKLTRVYTRLNLC